MDTVLCEGNTASYDALDHIHTVGTLHLLKGAILRNAKIARYYETRHSSSPWLHT